MNKEAIYRELGKKIKKARKNAELSQEMLAKRVGLSRTSITNIENGRQHISFHVIFDLSGALGIQPADLIPSIDSAQHAEIRQFEKKLSEEGLREEESKRWVKKVISSKIKED